MPILIFYLHFGLPSEIFPFIFFDQYSACISYIPYMLCSRSHRVQTHSLLGIRAGNETLGQALFQKTWICSSFSFLPLLHTDRQTDRHTYTRTHTHTRHVDTAKYVYLWSQEQGFHCHVNPNMYICFPYSCYMSISSCTNFFDHCNKIAGEW